MTAPTKRPRGGARQGAGRKRTDPAAPMVAISVRVTEAQRERFRARPDGAAILRAEIDSWQR